MIELEPGEHIIVFNDPYGGGNMLKGVFRASMVVGMAAFGMGLTGGRGALQLGEMTAALTGGHKIKDNAVQCVLNEGDVLKLSCKAKTFKVKIKALK